MSVGVTLLHPARRTERAARAAGAVSVLGERDVPELAQLAQRDPILNAVVCSRIEAAGTLRPSALGGTVLGVTEARRLTAAVFSGGNLIPVGGDLPAWTALAQRVSRRPRTCTAIVGAAEAVGAFWDVLEPLWGRARAVRSSQPLLVTEHASVVAPDPAVRRARPEDLSRYVAASAAMFTDELGQSPFVAPGADAFTRRVAELIRQGRAFASFDFRGQVMFKADLGVVCRDTCQIQGVWVRPDLRGRGVATAGLAAVIRHALTLAPAVSLYVNDFNTPARRVYAKLGMRQHATLSTVLL